MSALLERDGDLERLAELLEAARRSAGAALLVRGAPGIGKSHLLDAAAATAGRLGLRVLRARGGELEQDFPYGVVRQLLVGTPAPAAGAARLAAPALEPAPGGAPADEGAVLHGLYWLVAELAAEAPLAVVLDDAHWTDAPSLRFAVYLARRLEGLPVALLSATRPYDPAADTALLAQLAAEGDVLVPAELSEGALAALAADIFGAPAELAFAAAVARATGGNPLLARALLVTAREEGLAPVAAAAGRLAALPAAGVEAAVARRLARLGEPPRALARAAALLDEHATLAEAAALAGLEPDVAAGAAGALAAADLFEAGAEPAFRHPLVRAAVRATVPPPEQRLLHARAAEQLRGTGVPPPRVAVHLQATDPVGAPWALAALREAAAEATAQGVPAAAAALLRRALREPLDASARAALLRELGARERAAGRPDAARHLREAAAVAPSPRERLLALIDLGWALSAGMGREVVRELLPALEEAERVDRELALELAALLAIAGRTDMRADPAARAAVRRLAAGCRGRTEAERRLETTLAALEPLGLLTSAAEAAAQAERLLGADSSPIRESMSAYGAAVATLIQTDRLDAARRHLDAAVAAAQAGGSADVFATACGIRAWCRYQAGDVLGAEADARASLEARPDLRPFAPLTGGLVLVACERGALEEAEAHLTRVGLEGQVPESMLLNTTLFGRARLHAARGRTGAAIADLTELGARLERWGLVRPVPPWRSELALQLHRAGETERAPAPAREELELARTWGTPRAIGVALRALGVLEADPERLREAAEVLAEAPGELERARGLVELGAVLRRAGNPSAARAPLAEAMDTAHACGATTLAQRARVELRAAGARPRRFARSGADALTASERRVAELAAAGMSNRDIAQSLFVTQRTVETHLGHVYEKLGHSERERLAEALTSK